MRFPAALEGDFDPNEAGFLFDDRVFRGKTFFSARFFFSKSGFWGGFHPDSVKKGPFGAHY